MKRTILAALAATTLLATPGIASAATFVVSAQANSTSGGSPFITGLVFAAGQQFSISSSTNDLWSAGALPRFSDANGIVQRFAIAGDDSGQAPGTQIGGNFGNHSQGNLNARFGSLVAVLGANNFQLLGANGIFTSNGGPLNLAYFDSNSGDNEGRISFNIEAVRGAVPEPATWAMMIVGFGLAGFGLRGRRQQQARVTYA